MNIGDWKQMWTSGDRSQDSHEPWMERELSQWGFRDEEAACLTFDSCVKKNPHWMIFSEVEGEIVSPRIGSQGNRLVRIDRLMIPTDDGIAAGVSGVIGCEIKRSGKPIGPVVSQAMDYMRSVFTVGKRRSRVALDMCFVFPFQKQAGGLSSVMDQHRVGVAFYHRKSDEVMFSLGCGDPFRNTQLFERVGRKAGSR